MARCRTFLRRDHADQTAQLAVIFMDDNRASGGNDLLQGILEQNIDWQLKTDTAQSSAESTRGDVTIGLLGGTGEVSYDDIQISPPAGGK